jgi:hypothetical protein
MISLSAGEGEGGGISEDLRWMLAAYKALVLARRRVGLRLSSKVYTSTSLREEVTRAALALVDKPWGMMRLLRTKYTPVV